MNVNNNLAKSVKKFLASQHIYTDEEWLFGCVQYLCDDSDSNYSESDIQNLAKEQWLLNDLKDICPGSLPANLKNATKTLLNGKYILQINAAIDIGTPGYQQYLKLQKINTENIDATSNFDDKIPSHRMIKFYLTDGVQDITGIEYKPMRNISCGITPGCKALIKGPVTCRRGILLLTEPNVELLGGEVQEMAISNCLSGLLSSKLGVTPPQGQDISQNLPAQNAIVPTAHTELPTFNLVQESANLTNTLEENMRPIARVTSIQQANANFVDEDIDFDQLAAIEAEFTNEGRNKRTGDNANNLNPEKKFKPNTIAVNSPDDYPDENHELFDEDEDHLREVERKFDEKERFPIKVNSEPFVYIKQIISLADDKRIGKTFRIKGQILKLLSKLTVGKEGWSLRCTLIDGTGSIDADFTSDVLSKLIGFTPTEMNRLKKEMISKPELKEKAVTALQTAKDNLQVLYCIIELTMLDGPKITELRPFEEIHINLLNKRLESSGL